MRQLSVRVLAMSLVGSMVGLVAAASSSTTVVQTTAKMVAVVSNKVGGVKVPSTATAMAIHKKTTVVVNGTTFPPVKTLTISVKGLIMKSLPDGVSVGFNIKGAPINVKGTATPVSANLSNGTASLILDSSMGSAVPHGVSGEEIDVVYPAGSILPTGVLLRGVFVPATTTTK